MSEEKKQEKSILGITFKQWAGLLGAFAVGAAIMMMPTPAGLSVQGQKALGLFAAILVLWATEPVPLPIVSLLMVPAAILLATSVPSTSALPCTCNVKSAHVDPLYILVNCDAGFAELYMVTTS